MIEKQSKKEHNCKRCGAKFSIKDLQGNYYICKDCGLYFNMPAIERVNMLTDKGSFIADTSKVDHVDVLGFPGYTDTLKKNQEKSGLDEAVLTGSGRINGIPVLLGVMDSDFMMASMGHVVGEKITRLMDRAVKEKLPLIMVTASGGARMQEGIISLVQMAKTSGGVARMQNARIPYFVVLTNPTSGGVTASFAMLGDVIISEPNALICFAGPRLVKMTIQKEIPERVQRAESLLQHGFVDMIVRREDMKDTLIRLLEFAGKEEIF